MRAHFNSAPTISLAPSKDALLQHICRHVRPDIAPRDICANLGFRRTVRGEKIDFLLGNEHLGHLEPLSDKDEQAFNASLVHEREYPGWVHSLTCEREKARKATQVDAETTGSEFPLSLLWGDKAIFVAALIAIALHALV